MWFSKRFLIIMLFCSACVLMQASYGKEPQSVGQKISRHRGKTFFVRSEIMPNCEEIPDRLVILTACPETNMYQTISSFSSSPDVKPSALPHDCGKYLYFQQDGESGAFSRKFKVTFFSIKTNFSKIQVRSMPSGEQDYFTQNKGVYIVADHPDIRKIEKKISKRTTNVLDYAKKAYLYTAGKFKYLNPGTGLHPLQKILDDGGGDCGNLSSVFISLLRAKKIPARHVVGMRPDGSAHVWAEFYLDGAGWIPADVTADLGKHSLEHFGNINDNCIVMHRDIFFHLPNGKNLTEVAMIQNYCYWYWCSKTIGKVNVTFSFYPVKKKTFNR